MEIDLEQQGDLCILRVRGRMERAADLDYLAGKATEIRELRCTKLLGDFYDVPSIGSLGLGFVVGLYASIRKIPGGRIVLVGANQRVRHLLEITRVSTVIPLADDMDSGLSLLLR